MDLPTINDNFTVYGRINSNGAAINNEIAVDDGCGSESDFATKDNHVPTDVTINNNGATSCSEAVADVSIDSNCAAGSNEAIFNITVDVDGVTSDD